MSNQDLEEFIACGCGDLFAPGSRGEAFIDIFGECENCNAINDACSDIEGFIIDKSDVLFGNDGSEHEIIYADDLRNRMAGHVRVPVKVIERALAAVRDELNMAYNDAYPVCCGRAGEECCGSPEPEWTKQAMATMDNLGPIEKELAGLLNASKGEGDGKQANVSNGPRETPRIQLRLLRRPAILAGMER